MLLFFVFFFSSRPAAIGLPPPQLSQAAHTLIGTPVSNEVAAICFALVGRAWEAAELLAEPARGSALGGDHTRN